MNGKNIVNNRKVVKKRVSTSVVAEVAGCTPRMVKMVLNGNRSPETRLGQRIEISNMLLEEGMDKLVKQVEKIVKL